MAKADKAAIKRRLDKGKVHKKSGKVHGYNNVLEQIANGESISRGAAAKVLAKSGDYPPKAKKK